MDMQHRQEYNKRSSEEVARLLEYMGSLSPGKWRAGNQPDEAEVIDNMALLVRGFEATEAAIDTADRLEKAFVGAYLYGTAAEPLLAAASAPGFAVYFQQLLDEAGAQADPLERMLIASAALTFHNAARLLIDSAQTKNAEESALYVQGANRLFGEHRRLIQALQDYRNPPAAKVVQFQQNISSGDQQVAYLAGTTPPAVLSGPKNYKTSELLLLDSDLSIDGKVVSSAKPRSNRARKRRQAEDQSTAASTDKEVAAHEPQPTPEARNATPANGKPSRKSRKASSRKPRDA